MNFIRRYDARAQRWHDSKAAKTNPVIARKALGCKLAKVVWHILAEGCEFDGDRLFGAAKAAPAQPQAAAKQLGRASVSQNKRLKSPNPDA